MSEEIGTVEKYDEQRVMPGYVLYSAYSGDAFFLINRKGEVVHRWEVRGPCKIGELLPGAILLFARMRDGVFEADWNNNILWKYHCRQHHDFCRKPNGNTIALCNEFMFDQRVFQGAIDKNAVFLEVDRDLNPIWEWHSNSCVEQLIEEFGVEFPYEHEDWTRSNTVESLPDTPLGRRDPRFREGNVIFSFRNLDLIGVVDYQTGKIAWGWGRGELDRQHMPTMLPDGKILIFDNGPHRKWSRIIELDPETKQITWEYRMPDYAFAGALSGQEQLPNGNLLICCAPGVLLEINRQGEILWEYHNCAKGQNEATAVYRACWYPPEQVEPYL